MSVFDSIIAQTNGRFDLDGKAETLLSALLALMTDGNKGGLAGFLERFDRAGLGEIASSWINDGENAALSDAQFESALGTDTLNDFASQAGTNYRTATSAVAFMTPPVIDALTPDGMIPREEDLLSRIGGDLSGVADETNLTTPFVSPAETFDRIGTAVVDVPNTEKNIVGDKFDTVAESESLVENDADTNLNNFDNPNSDSPLKWITPLIILFLLLISGYLFCGKLAEPAHAPNTAANVNTTVNAANQ